MRCWLVISKSRPRTIDDVVEQSEVVQVLRRCVLGKADFPNFLLYGPPGTGKTSTMLAAAREMFGDIYKSRILELNASDERGIQVIRDKVKQFSQLTASGVRPDGRECPAFKIVILDEADSMTHDAQAALRRTMESEIQTTRFCLICNYVSRIIQPLTSRCAKFRFKPLGEALMLERLQFVAKEEQVSCDDEVLHALVDSSGGDMRRAITCLQSCSTLKGKGVALTRKDVCEITGVVPDEWVTGLLVTCQFNNFDKLLRYISDMMLEAYCSTQLLEQLHTLVMFNEDLTEKQKAVILQKLGLCSWRIMDGADEYIELLDLCCTMMGAYQMSEASTK